MQIEEKELKKLDFNKSEYEYFLENCNFTRRQLQLLNLRRQGYSIIEISLRVHLSESTVKRELKEIKRKIIKAIRLK